MAELVKLIHEISVAFARSANLRTLLPRLSTGMSRYSSVVEIQIVTLDRSGKTATLSAHSAITGRTWTGERSARFLHRQGVVGAQWCQDIEPARVASAVVASQLKIAVGWAGLLTISFETEISVEFGSEDTEILVDSLRAHCLRMGQLDTLARHARPLHRNIVAVEAPPYPEPAPAQDTDISVIEPQVPRRSETDISVPTIEGALVDCISAALQATHGRIYGDAGAAKLLGIKPSTLQSKMRKLGIERAPFTSPL